MAMEAFTKADCLYKTLTDFQTVIRVAAVQKLIKPHHIELLTEWSANPQAWSDHYIANHH
jgi:hypothetical protein